MDEYLALPWDYSVSPSGNEEFPYEATVLELGCVAPGKTAWSALWNIEDAIELWIENARNKGEVIPEPVVKTDKIPTRYTVGTANYTDDEQDT